VQQCVAEVPFYREQPRRKISAGRALGGSRESRLYAEWIASEKVHGANFCLETDGDLVEYASRSSKLGAGAFMNAGETMPAYHGFAQEAFRLARRARPDLRKVLIYGEYFGGYYPGQASGPGAKCVQKGVAYSPGNHFYAFDVSLNGDGYLDFDEARALLLAAGFPLVAAPLHRGSLDELLSVDVESFRTTLPALLGYPALDRFQIAEGLVIRPAKEVAWGQHRAILKKKARAFWEATNQPGQALKVAKATIGNDLAPLELVALEASRGYVNENRIRSVISKDFDLLHDGQEHKLAGLLAKDAWEEFEKEHAEELQELGKAIGNVRKALMGHARYYVAEWRRSQAASAGRERATSPVTVEAVGAACAQAARPVSAPPAGKVPFVFDMETGDPDDVLTLLFLGSHPKVELRAVTITPGTEEQVALVRWLLQEMNLTRVRLGAQRWPVNAKKNLKLEGSFYNSFGRSPAGEPHCEQADTVLLECCDASVTLVTGAPLHNLGDVLKMDGFLLGRWVAQGGFAGEGVVPRELQMEKFKGMATCPTWNFGGNIAAAKAALASSAIGKKVCVSKNVCHSVAYDDEFHDALRFAQHRHPKSFGMMYNAMDNYLRRKKGGKKLHDPLALAVALNESVCELVEVHLFCQKVNKFPQWGSKLCPGSNIWISIAYDGKRFRSTLLM